MTASSLAKLLRTELVDARFAVTHLAPGEIKVDSSESVDLTQSNLQATSIQELNSKGLRDLYKKSYVPPPPVTVRAHGRSAGSANRLEEFERLLDAVGVQSEGSVANCLGLGISNFHGSTDGGAESPERHIAVCFMDALWSYLLVDACLTSPRRTAAKLLRWTRGAPLKFETLVLLGGLNTAASFALANGLAVERLPRNSSGLEGRFPGNSRLMLSDCLDRTMLRIPCKVSPVLSNPVKDFEEHGGTKHETWTSSANIAATWPLPAGGIHELSQALSLACDAAVEPAAVWTDYGNHAHFGNRFGAITTADGALPSRRATVSTLTAESLKKAMRLQKKLQDIPASMQTAFQYWQKSKSHRTQPVDRLVFLRTALETLFLDSGNRGELTFRLAINGAWYTGRNRTDRLKRFKTLKSVYNAASTAVHSGRLEKGAERLLTDGQAICREAILKRLSAKQAPDWNSVIFGR